jgi:hypothetical protein
MHTSIPSVMQSVVAMKSIKCDYHAEFGKKAAVKACRMSPRCEKGCADKEGCHEMWEMMSRRCEEECHTAVMQRRRMM